MSKKFYFSPCAELVTVECEGSVLTGSVLVEDGSLTYYVEEDNQFA